MTKDDCECRIERAVATLGVRRTLAELGGMMDVTTPADEDACGVVRAESEDEIARVLRACLAALKDGTG